jgi:glyoxylase-like metal-dependent hydrolase (beta-lactamase superfamily II)
MIREDPTILKITQHGDTLIQLTRLFAFNCYLVREDDGFTLVDTGLSGSAAGILAAARQHGLPIVRIALTHAHADHVGSLDALAGQLPGVEVAATQRTAQFMAGQVTLAPDEPQTTINGGFVVCRTPPTTILGPRDRVGSLEVIAAPGHSPDHIAFLDRRNGTLIAGDAFQTQGGIAVAGVTRWTFPFPARATWHLPTALESAQRLAALKPARLAVGHGRVLETPQQQIKAAIRVAEKRVHSHGQTQSADA